MVHIFFLIDVNTKILYLEYHRLIAFSIKKKLSQYQIIIRIYLPQSEHYQQFYIIAICVT